jgi:hypothetical protein
VKRRSWIWRGDGRHVASPRATSCQSCSPSGVAVLVPAIVISVTARTDDKRNVPSRSGVEIGADREDCSRTGHVVVRGDLEPEPVESRQQQFLGLRELESELGRLVKTPAEVETGLQHRRRVGERGHAGNRGNVIDEERSASW